MALLVDDVVIKHETDRNTIFLLAVVPFRETIVEPPETDMVNEELNEENKIINTNVRQVAFCVIK